MNIELNPDKPIVLLGDIHGEYSVIENFCKQYTDLYILQVGDFGIGFQQNKIKEFRILSNISKFLTRSNNKLFIIRGNHDDPSYFDDREINDNITFLSDYSTLIQNNKRILCIGGGISIDRKIRKSGVSWWEGEEFNLDKNKIQNADVLVTHVAPNDFPISKEDSNSLVLDFAKDDPTLLAELKKEKDLVQELVELTQPKRHYFGHYHMSLPFEIPNRKYRCIDINEFLELKFQ